MEFNARGGKKRRRRRRRDEAGRAPLTAPQDTCLVAGREGGREKRNKCEAPRESRKITSGVVRSGEEESRVRR